VIASGSSLTIGLLLDDQVVAALDLPPMVWHRMARRTQARAMARGLTGPSRATLQLLPQRGAPRLVSALELCLTDDEKMTYVSRMPLSVLDPLVTQRVAGLRRAGQLPADCPVSYVALRPDRDDGEPFWTQKLPGFPLASTLPPPAPTRSLFPDVSDPDDVAVAIGERVLAGCVEWCRDRDVEAGGALLGHVLASGGRLRVEIAAFAPALGAASDATHLRFTAEAWSSILAFKAAEEQRCGVCEPLAVVGWAHGHPAEVGETVGTPFFLSPTDVEAMELSFAEPYACALVVDAAAAPTTPLAASVGAFGWDGYGICPVLRDLELMPGP
jgi:hypothetical protein